MQIDISLIIDKAADQIAASVAETMSVRMADQFTESLADKMADKIANRLVDQIVDRVVDRLSRNAERKVNSGQHDVDSEHHGMLTTRELARIVLVKPDSIRVKLCKTGSYYGLRPLKHGNRLLWPEDSLEVLINTGKITS